MKYPVYLDNNSTTPVDPRVLEVMYPVLKDHFGNASSSSHAYGWFAEELVEIAREQVAKAIGAESEEIVFTSGATESINLALQGSIRAARRTTFHHRPRVFTASTEHRATLDTLKALSDPLCGDHIALEILDVDPVGRISASPIFNPFKKDTLIISLMLAGNEVGSIHPIQEIAHHCKQYSGIYGPPLLHCDATQALGKLPLDVGTLGVDLLSISAHKAYGPKGVGALYVKKGLEKQQLLPLVFGGGQEMGLRSGTLNVPAIVGFGRAAELAALEQAKDSRHLSSLSENFIQGLKDSGIPFFLNGPPLHERLPGNLNLSFVGKDSQKLLLALQSSVACSSGSACSSHSGLPSYVLGALGHDRDRISSSLRFGIGRFNTEEDINLCLKALISANSHSMT